MSRFKIALGKEDKLDDDLKERLLNGAVDWMSDEKKAKDALDEELERKTVKAFLIAQRIFPGEVPTDDQIKTSVDLMFLKEEALDKIVLRIKEFL